MSGRAQVAPAGVLTEIPVYLMDAASGEGVTTVDPGDAAFVARFRRAGQTTDTTLTLTAVAANAPIAENQWRDYGDGEYTVVGSTAMYAAGARFVKLHVDCGTPAALSDTQTIFLSADDALSPAATPETIAAAVAPVVESQLTDNFAAIPGAVVTAMRTEVTLSAWGVTTQPAGGSTITYVERRNGVVIGSRSAFFNAANVCVGMTLVA